MRRSLHKQNLQSLATGAGGILLIVGGIVIANTEPPSAVPSGSAARPAELFLEARPPNMDFKSACAGRTLELEFHLHNLHAAPVRVESIVPSCGCTTVDFTQRELAPGESLAVKIKVQTPSKKHGEFRKAVSVLFRQSGEETNPRSLKVGIVGLLEECE